MQNDKQKNMIATGVDVLKHLSDKQHGKSGQERDHEHQGKQQERNHLSQGLQAVLNKKRETPVTKEE